MICCITRTNHRGKRIRTIDKDNITAVCPVRGENEDWENVELCQNNKDNGEEWEKALLMKIKDIE